MAERVQKILSQWGIASRRRAETLILAGRVRLNGRLVQLGDRADPQRDRLEVDGKAIHPDCRPQRLYILVNKPAGIVSSCRDPQRRSTVLDLLPERLRQGQGLHPVGRLDADSTGALLLTNDGELTLRLTHPRYHLPKTYQVWLQGCPPEAALQSWREGVMLSGKKTLPARVTVLQQRQQQTLLEVTLREGRNRQIRRIAEQLGFPVIRLHRTAIGSLPLHLPGGPSLASGHYRFLNDAEIDSLTHHAHRDEKAVALTR